jgi:hypothetical protein
LLIGLVADLIGFNRKIQEETLYRVRRLELSQIDQDPSVSSQTPSEHLQDQRAGERYHIP